MAIPEHIVKESRHYRPFAELIPWLIAVRDESGECEYLLNKDGSLTALFSYEPADQGAMGEPHYLALINALERAVGLLRPIGGILHVSLIRRRDEEYPSMPFAPGDRMAVYLDEHHRKRILSSVSYADRCHVALTIPPEKQSTTSLIRRIGTLMTEEDLSLPKAVYTAVRSAITGSAAAAVDLQKMTERVQRLHEMANSFSSILADLKPRLLQGDDLYTALFHFTNPWASLDLRIREPGYLLDAVLPDCEIHVYRDILCFQRNDGNIYMSSISVRDLPLSLAFNAMAGIRSLGGEVMLNHVFHSYTPEETDTFLRKHISALDDARFDWREKLYTIITKQVREERANRVITEQIEAARQLRSQAQVGEFALGRFHASINLFHEDPDQLMRITQDTIRLLHESSFIGHFRENLHLLSNWATTLPGSYRWCRRWLTITPDNFIDYCPWVGTHEGERINPHLTAQFGRPMRALTVLMNETNSKYYFNFHDGALGHTFVVGPSRSGKSAGMNFLISQYRKYQPNARVIVFDKDESCMINILLHEGAYYHFGQGEGGVAINPFVLLRAKGEDFDEHLSYLASWVERLLFPNPDEATSQDRRDILTALRSMAAVSEEHAPTMSVLHIHLPPRLADRLTPWLPSGNFGWAFSEEDTTGDSESWPDLQGYDITYLLREPQVARHVLDYLFYRISNSVRKDKSKATMLYIEECWFALDDPVFAARIKDWLKTFAKYNAFLVLCTQSIDDLSCLDERVVGAIRDNLATILFLPNPSASRDSGKDLYRKYFGLTPEQIEKVATAIPRRDYILYRRDCCQVLRLELSPEQIAVVRSDNAAKKVFRAIYSQRHVYGEGWQQAYLDAILGGTS
jgi:type IV secretion system protein VirB4